MVEYDWDGLRLYGGRCFKTHGIKTFLQAGFKIKVREFQLVYNLIECKCIVFYRDEAGNLV